MYTKLYLNHNDFTKTITKIFFKNESVLKAPNAFAKSVDPDDTARNEPSHLDLQCLPYSI